MRLRIAALLLLCCVACAHRGPYDVEPDVIGPPVVRTQAENPRARAVWLAVLELYAAGTIESKAAAIVGASAAARGSAQVPRTRIVLMDSTSHPYPRAWLDSLFAQHLVDGVCPATDIRRCPGAAATSFLSFGDPAFAGDTAVDVVVDDQSRDPAACRRRGVHALGGFIRAVLHLARHQGPWRLMESTTTAAGDYGC